MDLLTENLPAPAPARAAEGERRWTWWETGSLLLFTLTVALGLRWHEGWTDEAQAWLLARDMGWWQLILHGVRYEGTPGLWHSLLWVLARLHFTYIGMHYAVALFAIAGIAILLRYAPFPRIITLLIPFSFFLAYQDAVVARSYVLFTPLAFAAAALLSARRPRPLLLALTLGLIANMSIHGCIASAGLAAVAFLQARQRGLLGDRTYRTAAALLLFMWALAIATAAPPRDLDFAAAKNLRKAKTWITNPHEKGGGHWLYNNDQLPITPDPGKPYIVTKKDSYHSLTMKPGELAPIPLARARLPYWKRLWIKTARVLGIVTFPLSTSRSLAVAVIVLLVMGIHASVRSQAAGALPGATLGWWALLPWALPLLVFQKLYIAPRHAGVLFTLFIVALWLAWPQFAGITRERLRLRTALVTCLFLLLVQQAGWTKDAILTDKDFPYSGDWTTAKFLKTARDDGPVAGFYYHATGALAFLPGWHYINQPNAYWLWSTKLRTDQRAPEVLKQHPAYIVIGGFEWGPEGDLAVDWANPFEGYPWMPMADSYRIATYFEQHGYIETHRLCGRLLMRDEYSEQVCNLILEPYVAED